MQLAAQEAVAAGYREITPAHLLIALARLSDPEASGQVNNAGLCRELEHLGIEPRAFRRRLRALLGNGGSGPPNGVIHRTPLCRAVFALAQELASSRGAELALEHLLHATLCSLAWAGGPDADGADKIECPACRKKMVPVGAHPSLRCSACGAIIDHPVGPKEPGHHTIPNEL